MLAGQPALITVAVFSGAAVYVNFVEQHARLGLDDQTLLDEWMTKRGFIMQAPLAVLGCILGTTAWWQSGIWLWAAGALIMIANWPITLFVITPTNNQLMATKTASPES